MESEPTVIGRHSPPKASGVVNFSFPVYCVTKSKNKGKLRKTFVSWQPVKSQGGEFSCSLQLKEWIAFSWLPAKIKESSQRIPSNKWTMATYDQIHAIGRHQRILWSDAFKARKPISRAYDKKRKQRIASHAKGKKRVLIPTCTADDVLKGVKKGIRSETAVVLGPGSEKGQHQLMALKDGTMFSAPTSVVMYKDIAKQRMEFAVKHAQWGTHYCSCKVTVHLTLVLTLTHTLIIMIEYCIICVCTCTVIRSYWYLNNVGFKVV